VQRIIYNLLFLLVFATGQDLSKELKFQALSNDFWLNLSLIHKQLTFSVEQFLPSAPIPFLP